MTTAPSTYDPSDLIIARLEEQIDWYDRKSSHHRKMYKRIKLVEMISAALIPFLSALHLSDTNSHLPITMGTITALLGVLITILEGVLQLNQYQQNWVTFRATCEALRHEKYTYIANAGIYATTANSRSLLAERVESIVSQENSKWVSLQQPAKGPEPVGAQAAPEQQSARGTKQGGGQPPNS